jgi:hypothetical protein
MLALDAHERRERAHYWRAGLVTAAIVNANRKKGSQQAKPEDFVPRRRRRQPQGPAQMSAILKAFTEAMGGEVNVRS